VIVMVCWQLDSPLEQVAAGTPLHSQHGQFRTDFSGLAAFNELCCYTHNMFCFLNVFYASNVKITSIIGAISVETSTGFLVIIKIYFLLILLY
jgi:hypothetical protein